LILFSMPPVADTLEGKPVESIFGRVLTASL